MSESVIYRERFPWWLLACVAGCGALAFFPLTVWNSDLAAILYVFVAIPIVSLILLLIAYRRKAQQRLAALSVFAVFLVVTAILLINFSDMRNACRWLVYRGAFKAKLLAQSASSDGKLRHAEWEGWGFAGADTVVYLVFDPNNSLAAAAKTRSRGKFAGLPCDVVRVRRLESAWYAVQFYTETDWDNCN